MTITHKVEIAFATDPDAVTPTWTDVTSFVWAAAGGNISIQRGRADQESTISPSTMTLTLDNHDGRFTAGYTSGAYYPNVVLGKRIRVSTNAGAGFVERFDGYVSAWPVQWAPTGRWAEATITAVDRLARLGRQLTADNLISTYYLASSPTDYWMYADPEGTTTSPYNRSGSAKLTVGFGYPVIAGQSLTYGNGTGPGYDGLTAAQIKGTAFGLVSGAAYTFTETQSFTFSGFVRCDSSDPANQFVPINVHTDLSDLILSFAPSATVISAQNTAGTSTSVAGTANIYDGNTHHVAGVWKGLGAGSGGTLFIYVDGVLDNSGAISTAILSVGCAAGAGFFAEDLSNVGTYTIAHFAVFNSALSAGTIASIAAAGLNAFSGDTTLTRTTRLAGLAGVTPVVTGTAGTTSMAPLLDVGGTDYLSLLQTVADTESGLLFTQCDGQVRLRPRRDMQNQSTKWTLATGQYDSDITFLLDDFGVVNDVTADRPGGNPQHAMNSTSITANGTYSLPESPKTLQTTSDNEVTDYVNWTLANGVPAIRCSQVNVNLLTQSSLVTTWLTLELGDVIACTGLPSTSAPATSVTMQVQGWTEVIGLDTYSAQMNTAPYYSGSVFIFNDATFGKFNGPGVFGY